MSNIRTQKNHNIAWTDIENPSRQDLVDLSRDYGFHVLHIEECLAKGQLPQIEIEKDYIFLVLYFARFVPSEDRIVTSQVGVFLGKDYLVTVHEDSTPSIRGLFKECELDPEKRDGYFKESPGYLLYNIVGTLLVELENLIHIVLKGMDEIEDKVFDSSVSDAYQIGQLRHKIMKLRRITLALKNTLVDLSETINRFTHEDLARYYRSNAKITDRLWATVEEATETIAIYKDADYTTSAEKTNEILAVLTLLFTFTLPVTVVGTLYGMNVLVPGGLADKVHWTFFGPYTAFVLLVAASSIPAALMYWYFKRKKWF
jgi:magnesium transporter